jgi:hypothetical protein
MPQLHREHDRGRAARAGEDLPGQRVRALRGQSQAGDHHDEQQQRQGLAGARGQLGVGQDAFEVDGHRDEQQSGQRGGGSDFGGEERLPGCR